MILAFAYVSIENLDQTVVLSFLGKETGELHVFVLLLAAVLIGVLIGIGATSLRIYRMRRQLRRMAKQLEGLDREITGLREAPMQQLP